MAANDLITRLGITALGLFYQGQYRLADGSLEGAEALLRARCGAHAVPPPWVIERAEMLGLGDELALWTIDESMAAAAQISAGGLAIPVRVNLNERQLCNESFTKLVAERGLAEHGVEVELVETNREEDLHALDRGLGTLRAAGIRVWMDDFTGISADLQRLIGANAIEGVKLDKCFLRERLPDHPRAIDRLSRMMSGAGVTVLAEGIETAFDAELARKAGISLGQGYFFHRPEPLDQFLQTCVVPRAAILAGIAANSTHIVSQQYA